MKTLLVICAVLLALPCMVLATPLPDTGQTKCYNNTQEITCPNQGEAFYGQDAQYGPNLQSFTKLDVSGNDLPDEATDWIMVRDNKTGLIWEVKTDDGSIHDKDNTYTWYDARYTFTQALTSAQFGGHTGWRLPIVRELSGLVDNNISYPNPLINTDYFPNIVHQDRRPWSSATTLGPPDYIPITWTVNFLNGCVDDQLGGGSYAWAVLGNCCRFNVFKNNDDGTITDIYTGLMWELKTDDDGPRDKDNTYNWEQALSYCENLTLANHDDWRLPNRNELESIVDYSRNQPAIQPIFANTISWNYWSSTTVASEPSSAWFINFEFGGVQSSINKSDNLLRCFVRAVRGGQCGSIGDSDGDTVCDDVDNCSYTITTNVLDNYPPQGNGIGDACDCEGNFNCDIDVDGSDASTFKADFGRSNFKEPCTALIPCNGDFKCDGDVDGADAALFKSDFGRNQIVDPCLPPCSPGMVWCSY